MRSENKRNLIDAEQSAFIDESLNYDNELLHQTHSARITSCIPQFTRGITACFKNIKKLFYSVYSTPGLFYLVCLVMMWIAAGYVQQYLEQPTSKATHSDPNPPDRVQPLLILCVTNTATFVLYLNQIKLRSSRVRTANSTSSASRTANDTVEGNDTSDFISEQNVLDESLAPVHKFANSRSTETQVSSLEDASSSFPTFSPEENKKMTLTQDAKETASSTGFWQRTSAFIKRQHAAQMTHAILCSVLLLSLRGLWLLSLKFSAVSLLTAVYNGYIFIVLIFSTIFLREKITAVRVLATIVGFMGILCLTVLAHVKESSVTPPSSIATANQIGVILSFVSSIIYSIYTVFLKWIFRDASPGEIARKTILLLSRQGLFSIVWAILLLIAAHYLSIERFRLPALEWKIWVFFLISFLLAAFYYFFLGKALCTTSPVLIAVGTLLTMPGTLIIDIVFYNLHLTLLQAFGCLCIFLSFSAVVLNDLWFDQVS